jgi:hypothetical protein
LAWLVGHVAPEPSDRDHLGGADCAARFLNDHGFDWRTTDLNHVIASPAAVQEPQTYSNAHIRRQREAHARADGYGRHRHFYLHGLMGNLKSALCQSGSGEDFSWLDYGCGKGGFIEEIRKFHLFRTIVGHDPAVEAFRRRPTALYDIVTCLDVLDIVESGFQDRVITDVAAFTRHFAVFDCLTRPKLTGTLRPHPPFYWTERVRRHMDVVETRVEFSGMQDFERAVIIAVPRGAA